VVWRLENAEFQSRALEPDSVAQKAVDSIPILRSSILNRARARCRARARARLSSTGNGLAKLGSKSRTITITSTSTIEEPTSSLALTLTLTLPLTARAEPEEGSPSGIRFLEYEEEPGDRVAVTDI
jgi:hypothetical protein